MWKEARSTLIILAGVAFGAAACSGPSHGGAHQGAGTSPSTTQSAPSSESTGNGTGASAPSGSKPAIPSTGAYLGAWVNPNHVAATNAGEAGGNETSQLPSFVSSIRHNPAILHVYTNFQAPVPMQTVDTITNYGAVPMIDWDCTRLDKITSGSEDSVITTYAQTLRSYGKPVFLRWYWEVNQNTQGSRQCGGYGDGPAYISAWQHIWTLFQQQHASNVAFVWCPGLKGGNYAAYYPGDNYVDWICVDGYDRAGTARHVGSSTFTGIFGSFYDQWVGHGKPIMVGETGATAYDQGSYIQSIQSGAPELPEIKAVVYFDAVGPEGDWSLTGTGLQAFQSLVNDSYFSFRD